MDDFPARVLQEMVQGQEETQARIRLQKEIYDNKNGNDDDDDN